MNSIRAMHSNGFTIIEVMLFLAVSSLLAVLVLGGASVAINQQRYKDTLNSLQALIQQQYTETAHVVNGRSTDDTATRCTNASGSAKLETGLPTGGDRPGRSECLVIGKVIIFEDRSDIKIANILGVSTSDTSQDTDIKELRRYSYVISTIDQVSSEVAWGGELTIYRGSDQLAAGESQYIALLRSPLTGIIRTFSFKKNTDAAASITLDDITEENMNIDTRLCVDRDLFSVGYQQGVLINKRAGSQSDIELLTSSEGCSA